MPRPHLPTVRAYPAVLAARDVAFGVHAFASIEARSCLRTKYWDGVSK